MASIGERVLVTGGSGFVATHCILQLLEKGYNVITTVRSLALVDEVRDSLKRGGAAEERVKSVDFSAADLSKDDGWDEACKGCTYVLHIASPFPASAPKHENDLIVPARDGALRVLKSAKGSGTVKRVVMTSSFAAIGYGHSDDAQKLFTEEDWTNLENPAVPVPPYQKSKTIAERAAWDFVTKNAGSIELAVVNPTLILGPVLSKRYASSVELVSRLINGQIPGCPDLVFGVVDVRDVASLHILAMTDPKANGQRFLATADGKFLSVHDMALALKNRLGEKAKKVSTRKLPNILLRILGFFDPSVRMVLPELSKYKNASNEKAKATLGWQPRSPEDALVATVQSLEQLGLVK
ncbi:MAG: hypothetical protein FE78DRAFT_288100 [Acidomyces sp. 'richmondensis']|nr:MAG: hypothetical protein FE78DRAFT_288100 [Acidomyces sp. 'richmondensis']